VDEERNSGFQSRYYGIGIWWWLAALVVLSMIASRIAACDDGAAEQPAPAPAPPSAAVPPAPAQPQTPAAPPAQPTPVEAAQPAQPAEPGTVEGAQPAAADTRDAPNRKDGDNRTLPVDLVRFVPEGSCTRRKCPPEKPCCNTCRFRRWTPQTGPHLQLKGSTAAMRNIPKCKMNGCQRCAFHLLANGVKSGNKFMAFDIRKVKPASAKKHVPAP
jgi:hypothetical protein